MRHVRSLLYALVLAPALWTLSAVAFTEDLTGRGRTEQTVEALAGLLLLLLAGAAYAILLLPRLSPVGPATAGAVFLAASIWVLVDRDFFRGLWPAAVTKPGFDLPLPAEGLAALLAVPLLCTALSARRWRASPVAPAAEVAGTFAWPFARPSGTGTLVVPGAPGEATEPVRPLTEDRTQALRGVAAEPVRPAIEDRTQVLWGDVTEPMRPLTGDPTQMLRDDTTEPVRPLTEDRTQVVWDDATEPVRPLTEDPTQMLRDDTTEPVRPVIEEPTQAVSGAAPEPQTKAANAAAPEPQTKAANAAAPEQSTAIAPQRDEPGPDGARQP